MSIEVLISLILFFPLIGGFSDYLLADSKRLVASFFVAGSFVSSVYLLFSLEAPHQIKWEWIPGLQVGILVDKPAACLLAMVGLISLLVHLFSLHYMKEDEGKHRYFAKLGFFTFSMLGLLISDNLILLFIFWELVGFASYLLIGFWYQKEGVAGSARIAFMVNRVADVALFAGILLLRVNNETLFVSELNEIVLFLPSLLIAIGAFGKSAQVPFSGWLIKAMVGPTPVSALIHAATMVAAGVYLLFRVGQFLHPAVLTIVAIVGAVTALYGAISAMSQNDIKKVLAYSTISQLGYMVLGIGVGAGEASLFHLWTHAFFKAGLFLGAGVIIHQLNQLLQIDSQDIRSMGGLRGKLPWTFASFAICCLALAGIPFFSGFMSKEGILLAAWAWADEYGTWAYLVPDIALITILITAFYVGRLFILVFLGESRNKEVSGMEFLEVGFVKAPLALLALGSVWLGYSLNPLSHQSFLASFLGQAPEIANSFISSVAMGTSIFLSIAGLVLAYFLFRSGSAYSHVHQHSDFPRTFGSRLILNGFYFNSAYQQIGTYTYSLARGLKWLEKKIDHVLHFFAIGGVVLAKVFAIVDRLFVDGLVNLSALVARFLGKRTAGVHSRESQWQIMWLLIAFVLILGWILLF